MPNFIIKIIQAICCIAIIFYYDPIMALISIISTPVMVLFSRTLMSKMRIFSKRSREASSKIFSFIQESYSNMQSIKAFGIVEDFNLKFKMIQSDYYAVVMEQNKFAVLTRILMSLIGMIVSYSCYGWGVYRLWSGVITFGTMQMFLQLASSLSGAFSALVSMVPTAIGTLIASRRLIDVVSLQKEAADPTVDVERIRTEAAQGVGVHIENGKFAYEEPEEIFSCFSFDANSGDVVAIVGPSGAGKTTLFRILLGIVELDGGTGEICYDTADGEKRYRLSPSTRGLFAYVPQGNTLFYGTVADHMRLFRMDATEEEIVEALKTACAWDFVSQLENGIHTVIEESGNNFSEGQKQRLCIARALISDAPIVLLDEGTSALDNATERRLLQNLAASRQNKTYIVSTHRTSVLDICDRTYSIEDRTLRPIRNNGEQEEE